MTNMYIGLVVGVLLIGGWFVLGNDKGTETMMQKDTSASMEKTDGVMEKKDEPAMMEKKDEAMMEKDAMMTVGSYEAYAPEKLAKASTGDVVLFFRAGWCPSCRTVDADIKAHLSAIPAGLTILDVNYDTSSDLKKKYGVTYQHTFVQVDAQGTLIKKWSGSPTLAALSAEVQ